MSIRRRWRRLVAFWFGRKVSHYTKNCHCEQCIGYRMERFCRRCYENGTWSKQDTIKMLRVML